MTPLITVFTPTYNRAYTLPQLYNSLCRQTCKDFVWSIVDDGSTDNTEELINSWIEERKIPISYQKQPNGGKMRAHNVGVRLCNTPLFTCIDSDDYVVDSFIKAVKDHWSLIEKENKIAGCIAYRAIKNEDGVFRVKCNFPCMGLSPLGQLYKQGFYGDTTIVFKTNILCRFPFPEIKGEKFITESYAYDQIDQEYEYLLVDEAWIMCTYMPDGYTHDEYSIRLKNPQGSALYYNQKAKYTHKYFSKEKLGYAINYMIYARRAKMRNIYKNSELKTPLYPIFLLLSYYYEWKWKQKFPK